MSHLTTIKTRIKNSTVLEQVLVQLISTASIKGDTLFTNASLVRNGIVSDYFGNSTVADFVIRRPSGDIGLKKKC